MTLEEAGMWIAKYGGTAVGGIITGLILQYKIWSKPQYEKNQKRINDLERKLDLQESQKESVDFTGMITEVITTEDDIKKLMSLLKQKVGKKDTIAIDGKEVAVPCSYDLIFKVLERYTGDLEHDTVKLRKKTVIFTVQEEDLDSIELIYAGLKEGKGRRVDLEGKPGDHGLYHASSFEISEDPRGSKILEKYEPDVFKEVAQKAKALEELAKDGVFTQRKKESDAVSHPEINREVLEKIAKGDSLTLSERKSFEEYMDSFGGVTVSMIDHTEKVYGINIPEERLGFFDESLLNVPPVDGKPKVPKKKKSSTRSK